MSALSKRISTLCFGLLTALLLNCGGQAQGEIETGTDFTMAVTTSQFAVPPGTTVTTDVNYTWVGCPGCPLQILSLDVQGLPRGVRANVLNSPSFSGSQLQLIVDSTTKSGTYDILLRAYNLTLVHTKTLKLTVDPALPGFTATITPATLAMDANVNGVLNIQIIRTGGFSTPAVVSATLPLGFDSNISVPIAHPATAPAAAPVIENQTLTIRSLGAAPGVYNIPVQVLAGSLLFQQTIQTTVFPLPAVTGFTATPAIIDLGGSSNLLPTFTDGTGAVTPAPGAVTSGQTSAVAPLATTTYTLTVTNPVGSTATGSATVTVNPVIVGVAPAAGTLSVSKTTALTATITGAVNPALIWSVVEAGGGTVVGAGLNASYTAPALPGTYHVRATSVADPAQFGEFTATVVALPTASLSAAATTVTTGTGTTVTPVFTGGSAALSPALGVLSSGVGLPTGPLSSATTYTLTVTNAAGDVATSSVTITIVGVPFATITGPANVTNAKVGYAASVPVQTGVTYAWSFTGAGCTFTSATNGPSVTFDALPPTTPATTSLNCTVTNAAGTPVTGTLLIGINPLPTASLATSAAIITAGDPVTLTPTFTGGTASLPPLLTPLTSGVGVSVTPASTTTYTLTVTNPAGDSVLSSQTITVVAAPSITSFVTSASPINRGASSTVTATFSADTAVITPTLPGNPTIVSGTPFSTGTLLSTTLYTLTVTNAAGTSIQSTVPVTVNPVVVTVSPNPYIITSNNARLFNATVTGAVDTTVTWSVLGGGAGGSVTTGGMYTAPAGTGTDQLVATSNSDPSQSATVPITVVAMPVISSFEVASVNTTTPNVILAALYGEPLTFTATFSNGTATINNGYGAITSGVPLSGAGIKAQPSGVNTVTLTVTNAAGNNATANVSITVPTVTIAIIDPAIPITNLTAGGGGMCLEAVVSGAYDPNYTWAVVPGTGGTIGNTMDCTGQSFVSGSTPGTYLIQATSDGDPTVSSNVTANVVPPPVITAFTLDASVPGTNSVFMAFTGSATGNADLYDNTDPSAPVLLSSTVTTGQTRTDSIPPLTTLPEAYKLVVSNAAGMTVSDTVSNITVAINEGATYSMAGQTATSTPTHTFTATVTGSSAGVNWSTDGTTDFGTIDASGNYAPYSTPGTFILTAESKSDPNKTDTIAVTVIPIFITPGNQVVGISDRLVMRAAVVGGPTTTVGWSLNPAFGVGTIDPTTGVYSGPGTAGPPTVKAVATLSGLPTVQASVPINIGASINAGSFTTHPFAPATERTGHTLTVLGFGDALVAGGEDPVTPAALTASYQWHWNDNTFYNIGGTSPMGAFRNYATATLLHDGSVLLTGGLDVLGVPQNTAERFYPSVGSVGGYWLPVTAPMVKARAFHTATMLNNGKVLLVGGKSGASTFEDTAELYDPVTDAFTAVPGVLDAPRIGHMAVRVLDGRVLIAGGSRDGTPNAASLLGTAAFYNPTTNTLAATDPLLGLELMNAVADLAPTGIVHVSGGIWNPSGLPVGVASNRFFTFDPNASPGSMWNLDGSNFLNTLRNLPIGMILPSQLFVVMGGYTDIGITESGTVDFFNTVTPGAPTFFNLLAGTPRVQGATGRMVLLPNGKVMVVGTGTKAATLP